jgi:Fe2+ or Zn2+ uptake regulation protein
MKLKKPGAQRLKIKENLKHTKALAHSHVHIDVNHLLESACVILRNAGLKRTPNRESLLRFLIENHGPFSKEEIQKALPKEDFDSVTLYRNLASFEELGLVRRSEFGDGVSRYEFQSHPDNHHHHIVCTTCHKVDSLDSCSLPKLDEVVEKFGYSKVRHSLEFFGVCKDCSRKQE